jgi:hypothetical protein
MPPRRSARVAAVSQQSACLVAALPLPLTLRILMLLPVDARARACCVCRAWRLALEDPVCWTHLDWTCLDRPLRGVGALGAALHAAAAKARGQLRALSVVFVARPVLVEVLTANAASLRELRLGLQLLVDDLEGPAADFLPSLQAVMAAAPLLQVVEPTYVSCEWQIAPALLRAAPPAAAVVVRELYVHFRWREDGLAGMERVGPFAAALADAACQPALTQLGVVSIDAAALDAVLDAALARRLPSLSISESAPPAASTLTRLLRGNALRILKLCSTHGDAPLFDAAGAALVADALRGATTLTELTFLDSGLCRDPGAAHVLLTALVGHPSLRELNLECERSPAPAERGAALAAIVAADAPALQHLDVYCARVTCTCRLGDAGLAPLVTALRRNRHLRRLNISCNEMSEEFAREVLLPAVRANTSLRELACDDGRAGDEAMNLVAQRELQAAP